MSPARSRSQRGDLKFRLHGEKLNGDFALVQMKGRGKGNEWLIIKKRDEFAERGWDIESLRLQRALRPHAGRDRAQSAGRKKSKRKTAGAADRVWASSRPAKTRRRNIRLPPQSRLPRKAAR